MTEIYRILLGVVLLTTAIWITATDTKEDFLAVKHVGKYKFAYFSFIFRALLFIAFDMLNLFPLK